MIDLEPAARVLRAAEAVEQAPPGTARRADRERAATVVTEQALRAALERLAQAVAALDDELPRSWGRDIELRATVADRLRESRDLLAATPSPVPASVTQWRVQWFSRRDASEDRPEGHLDFDSDEAAARAYFTDVAPASAGSYWAAELQKRGGWQLVADLPYAPMPEAEVSDGQAVNVDA